MAALARGGGSATRMRARQVGQSALLLTGVLEALDVDAVDYLIVHAVAACVQGVAHAGLDADEEVFAGVQRARALTDRRRAAGSMTSPPCREEGDPIGALIGIDDRYANRVDLLMDLRGLSRATLTRAIDAPFRGMALRVHWREDFTATKLRADGPKDLDDPVASIETDLEAGNVVLLRQIAERCGRETVDRLEALLRVQGLSATAQPEPAYSRQSDCGTPSSGVRTPEATPMNSVTVSLPKFVTQRFPAPSMASANGSASAAAV